MAEYLRAPLAVVRVVDGRPVFNTRQRPAAVPTAAVPATAVPPKAPSSFSHSGSAAPRAPQTAAAEPSSVRLKPVPGLTNRYAGLCLYCQKWVEPEQGGRVKDGEGKWHVMHTYDCLQKAAERAPAERPVKKANAKTAPERPVAVLTDDGESVTGYYTVEMADGGYVTVRVRRQPTTAKFKPGRVAFAYLFGRSNVGEQYSNFASVDAKGRCWMNSDLQYKPETRAKLVAAISAVVGDPKTAGEAWARLFEACWICGRALSTPESLNDLIGPDCKKKRG